MGGRFYEDIPPNVDMRCYFNIAHEIIKEIAKYEKQKHLTRELLKPMRSHLASLVSRLKLTVNTHKVPGKVGHRNIHAAEDYDLKRFDYMGDEEA